MKIVINDGLAQRAADLSKKAGYSSLQEFLEHIIEKELQASAAAPAQTDDEDMKKRLQGLGYID